MATEDLILTIEKPHVAVKLHKNLLEVDLKKGMKKKLEDALEKKPLLRESVGYLFQSAVPLDVSLRRISSVTMSRNGQVTVAIPFRKDIVIPLSPKEAKGFVDKLNEQIAIEKRKAQVEDVVMTIDKPDFSVKLHKSVLEVDLKESVKRKLERALESSKIMEESLGFLFQTIIPLDVQLKDIETVNVDEKGRLKIVTPHRRDLAIPLELSEANLLADKLNILIPIEKEIAYRMLQPDQMLAREQAMAQAERARAEGYAAAGRETVR